MSKILTLANETPNATKKTVVFLHAQIPSFKDIVQFLIPKSDPRVSFFKNEPKLTLLKLTQCQVANSKHQVYFHSGNTIEIWAPNQKRGRESLVINTSMISPANELLEIAKEFPRLLDDAIGVK